MSIDNIPAQTGREQREDGSVINSADLLAPEVLSEGMFAFTGGPGLFTFTGASVGFVGALAAVVQIFAPVYVGYGMTPTATTGNYKYADSTGREIVIDSPEKIAAFKMFINSATATIYYRLEK